MDWLSLIACGLAAWQAVEVWHHGALFTGARARVELWEGGLFGFVRDVLLCPFCLSVWVATLAVALLWLGWPGFIVYALAVARLANLGNDLTHRWCRTPRPNVIENPDDPG